MTVTDPSTPRAATPAVRSTRAHSLAERLVLGRLARLRAGRLTVRFAGDERVFGDASAAADPSATLQVVDKRFFRALLLRGSVGAAEAFVHGWWRTDDLVALIRIFVRNREALEGVERGFARLSRPFLRLRHALRRNTRAGSKRNISAHYDLSNEFFALFLDETMTYSCGVFEREDSTLREASIAKLERICRKLELAPGDHLLEIGTGWGALAVHAAREYGCRVTTTTISKEQHAFASRRIREAGLADRVELLLKDYRDLEGRYDKLVSVEMIEAVGHRHHDAFFRSCARLLADDGRMLLQAITIADQHYEDARVAVDFIQRHIFPGSCIPSVTALATSMTRASDLRLVHLEDITPHYVRTLAAWRDNLFANRDAILGLGMDEPFLRLWEYYLAYCEGGFAERHIGDVHMLLHKSGCRVAAPLAAPGT